MSFLSTFDISASALTAERFRLDIIAQNVANINTTRTEEGGPYRRRLVVLEERALRFTNVLQAARRNQSTATGGGVRVQQVAFSDKDFIPVYSPSHPDADEEGYVMMPNVDRAEESIDAMAAQRSYEAQITTLNVIKAMTMKAAEITK